MASPVAQASANTMYIGSASQSIAARVAALAAYSSPRTMPTTTSTM